MQISECFLGDAYGKLIFRRREEEAEGLLRVPGDEEAPRPVRSREGRAELPGGTSQLASLSEIPELDSTKDAFSQNMKYFDPKRCF